MPGHHRVTLVLLTCVAALSGCGGDESETTLDLLMNVDDKTSFTETDRHGDRSVGDRFGFAGWSVTEDGKPAGTGFGLCTSISDSPQPVEEVCEITLQLDGGDLMISGVRNIDEEGAPQALAIGGGTGDYAGEGGEAVLEIMANGNFHLTLQLSD